MTNIKDDDQSSVITRVAVKCPCDNYSNVEQIRGRFYPGAPNDQMAFDIIDADDNTPEADVLFKAWDK